jgi:ankyrin repeat protein
MLGKCSDINKAFNKGATALYIDSQEGNIALASSLLDSEADINKSDETGTSSLYTLKTPGIVVMSNTEYFFSIFWFSHETMLY